MTTLLPNDEVDFLRSIRKTAIVLMAMGLIDRRYPGRAVKPDEMAGILEVDPRTVEKYMISLASRGRLVFNGIGYVLTDGGRALILGSYEAQALAQSPVITGTQAQALEALADAGSVDVMAQAGQHTHNVCVLLEEEESLNQTLDVESSSSDSSTQNVQSVENGQPTTEQILAKTDLLFETSMTLDGIKDRSRRMAIGWVAQAYDQRRHLRSPQGLIFARLRDNRMPLQKYYDRPRAYLPDEYLEALGLIEKPAVTAVTGTDETEIPGDVVEETPANEIAQIVHQPIPGTRFTSAMVWDSVKGQLQSEMPRSGYDTWVRDTFVVRFEDCRIYVACRNAYARDWLESRLTSAVNRILIGILNTTGICVRFVVSQAEAIGEQ